MVKSTRKMLTDRDMSVSSWDSWSFWTRKTMLNYSRKVLLNEDANEVEKNAENEDNSHKERTSVIDTTEDKQLKR